MKVLIDQLNDQAQLALQSGRITDYQTIVYAYRDTWTSIATEAAAAAQKFPTGTSETAQDTLYAIRRALEGEATSSVQLGRPEFSRLAVSVVYSLLITRSQKSDWTSVAQLLAVLQGVCSTSGGTDSHAGRTVFEYTLFRLFELGRVYGLRLTDDQLPAKRRLEAAQYLDIHARIVEVLLQSLLDKGAVPQAIAVDMQSDGVLPTWRQPPHAADGSADDDPGDRWVRLLRQHARTRYAMACWAWTHPSRPARGVLLHIAKALSGWGTLQATFVDAIDGAEEQLGWWAAWLLQGSSAIPSADYGGVPVDLIRTFLWLALERIEVGNPPPLTHELAAWQAQLAAELQALQVPEAYLLPDEPERRATLAAGLAELH